MVTLLRKVKIEAWILTRHGQEVYRAATEQTVTRHLQRIQPLTVQQALCDAGYRIEPVRAGQGVLQ